MADVSKWLCGGGGRSALPIVRRTRSARSQGNGHIRWRWHHARMSQQFLHGANLVSLFQQVRGELKKKGMSRGKPAAIPTLNQNWGSSERAHPEGPRPRSVGQVALVQSPHRDELCAQGPVKGRRQHPRPLQSERPLRHRITRPRHHGGNDRDARLQRETKRAILERQKLAVARCAMPSPSARCRW